MGLLLASLRYPPTQNIGNPTDSLGFATLKLTDSLGFTTLNPTYEKSTLKLTDSLGFATLKLTDSLGFATLNPTYS